MLDTEKLSDGWKSVKSLNTNRGDHCSVVIDEIAYVFGGFNHHDQWAKPLDSLEAYDSEIDQWSSLASLPMLIWQSLVGNFVEDIPFVPWLWHRPHGRSAFLLTDMLEAPRWTIMIQRCHRGPALPRADLTDANRR